MKKQSIQKKRPRGADTAITNTAGASTDTRITPVAAQKTDSPKQPERSARSFVRWLVLLAIIGLGAGTTGAFLAQIGPFDPRAPEEKLIARFVRLKKQQDKAALQLLGPAAVFDERPVSEKVAEEKQTDFFLRSDLKIVDVLPGEPDGQGSQRRAMGRYTLVTKGNVSSPKLMVRGAAGAISPDQVHMTNPDLVVEVRDGKIYGLRAELPMRP